MINKYLLTELEAIESDIHTIVASIYTYLNLVENATISADELYTRIDRLYKDALLRLDCSKIELINAKKAHH